MLRTYLLLPIARLSTAALLPAYPNRVPAGNAGVPGENNPPCTSCHTVSLNPAGGSVTLTFAAGTTYQPGVAQQVTVRISDPDTSRDNGFQATARTAANAQAGTFTAGTGTAVTTQGALSYINHTTRTASYTFTWTPPADALGAIRFYVAGMAARNTRDSKVYTATAELTPAASGPTLRSTGAVVNAAGFQPRIAPGAWVTLFGENLAGVTRTWTAAEIVGGQLPKSLDGVSVTVNGKDAAVYFISPTQINVQAPDDASAGTVEVKVTTPAGTAATTAVLERVSPGLFTLSPESGRYAAAVHADGTLVGKAEIFGGTVAVRAAKPGDIVLLFGTGFGETAPLKPAGRIVDPAAALANPSALRVRIGGVQAQVLWAGLVSAGLYQFNVQVPVGAAAGDQLLTVDLDGQSAQAGVYLTVGQ
ncbi:MAG: hypothetical protein IT162_15530 [Bryobacterales bacterium]|nr:hypothetical protein [Bryobacterales bacterium]